MWRDESTDGKDPAWRYTLPKAAARIIMRKAATFVAIIALFAGSAGTSVARPPGWCVGMCTGIDGSWWQRLPAAEKPAVLKGMIASYIAAYDLAKFNVYASYLTVYDNSANQKRMSEFISRFRTARQNRIPEFSQSLSHYVAAIDRFYARYPAKRPLDVTGLLRCLRDHAEFSCERVGKSMLLPWPTGP